MAQNANENQVTATNLFGKMFLDGDKALKKENLDRAQRNLQRRFEAYYDDADRSIDDNNDVIAKERAKLNKLDISVILRAQREIENLEDVKTRVKQEYTHLFGEEMRVR